MMNILYDLGFLIFGLIYLPYLVVTKRYRHGLASRMGILPERVKDISSKGKVIWIHAVSVGEIKAASILAPLLRKTFPDHTLLFSTVTHTGNKVAKTIATGDEGVFYLPFDISFIVNRVIRCIKPEIFLCLETELWPNLISSLSSFNSKVILVNGRISDKSFSGYKKIRFITSSILKKFSLIVMQSEKDKDRILDLGAPKDKVFATGNLKFDLAIVDASSERHEIREKLNIPKEDILLVAGSTHRGEEEQILNCFSKLKNSYKNLRLLIAPRHIERTGEIEGLLNKLNFTPVKVSSLDANKASTSLERDSSQVLILDAIGDLKNMYSASDIVFVGGSLVKKGGQNPIEPAVFSKPIIIGKFTFNFQDVVRSFLEDNSCIQVGDEEGLCSAITSLLDNPNERKKLGARAKDTVDKNSGSSLNTLKLIQQIL